MVERKEIQEKFILDVFDCLEKVDGVTSSEEIYFISKNHVPNDFKTQIECDLFLKTLIEEEKINRDRLVFDVGYFNFPVGMKILVKGLEYECRSFEVKDLKVEYHLIRTSDLKKVVLCSDYDTKELFFKHDKESRFTLREVVIPKKFTLDENEKITRVSLSRTS